MFGILELKLMVYIIDYMDKFVNRMRSFLHTKYMFISEISVATQERIKKTLSILIQDESC